MHTQLSLGTLVPSIIFFSEKQDDEKLSKEYFLENAY